MTVVRPRQNILDGFHHFLLRRFGLVFWILDTPMAIVRDARQ